MATPKQVRAVMRKIYYHRRKLANAIFEAKEMKVIEYDRQTQSDKNPAVALWKTESLVDETTQTALAKAMRSEIMKGMKS